MTERLAQANIFDPILDFAGRSGLINEAGRTHGTPRCRLSPSTVATGAYLRPHAPPTIQASATRLHRIIRRCELDAHSSIATSMVHPHRDHPARPLGDATARSTNSDWRAYVAVNGHVVLLPTDSCAPYCAALRTQRRSLRVTHMNEHGQKQASARATVRPHARGATAVARYIRPGRDAIRSANLDV